MLIHLTGTTACCREINSHPPFYSAVTVDVVILIIWSPVQIMAPFQGTFFC